MRDITPYLSTGFQGADRLPPRLRTTLADCIEQAAQQWRDEAEALREDLCKKAWQDLYAGKITHHQCIDRILRIQGKWAEGALVPWDSWADEWLEKHSIPPVPPILHFLDCDASSSTRAIRSAAREKAARLARLSTVTLDAHAEALAVPGDTPEAKRRRLCDARWLFRAAVRAMRQYIEKATAAAAPLTFDRCAPETLDSSREQDTLIDAWARDSIFMAEDGFILTPPDLEAQKRRRQAYLFARQRGLADKAKALDMVPYMITVTCPSAYHPTTTAGTGDNRRINPHWDPNLTPLKGHTFLMQQARALGRWASKNNIHVLGLRAVHPHADGTPHHHHILFIHPEEAQQLLDWIEQRARRIGARVDARRIYPLDSDGNPIVDAPAEKAVEAAMAYAAAYARGEHSARYKAWRRAWAIRAFAFFEYGGDDSRGIKLTWACARRGIGHPEAIEAARAGKWAAFEDHYRKHHYERIYEERQSRYGEWRLRLSGIACDGIIFPIPPRRYATLRARAALMLKESRKEAAGIPTAAETPKATAPPW